MGKSLLTSVGVRDDTIWIHDAGGDRQLSSEGNAFRTTFSRDGSKLYYLMQSGQNAELRFGPENWAAGKTERVVSAPPSCPGPLWNFTASLMTASRLRSR